MERIDWTRGISEEPETINGKKERSDGKRGMCKKLL